MLIADTKQWQLLLLLLLWLACTHTEKWARKYKYVRAQYRIATHAVFRKWLLTEKKNVFVRAVVILYCRSQVKRLAELFVVNYKCICQGVPLSATMLCKWLPWTVDKFMVATCSFAPRLTELKIRDHPIGFFGILQIEHHLSFYRIHDPVIFYRGAHKKWYKHL